MFDRQEKVLGLGNTNESLMAVCTGESLPEKWIGKTIVLEVREVNSAAGGTEPAIRIMPPNGTKMRSGLLKQLGKRIEAIWYAIKEACNQPGKDAAK